MVSLRNTNTYVLSHIQTADQIYNIRPHLSKIHTVFSPSSYIPVAVIVLCQLV